jgi:hypothetical protein
VAISDGRLVSLSEGRVTFRWRDSADGNRQKLTTFLLHVLPRGFVKIRHFAFLANRNRRVALAVCRLLLHSQEATPGETRPSSPDRKCPVCGVGILHTIALIPAAELATLTLITPFATS